MDKYVILVWKGLWYIYQPHCGRATIPFFDTREDADKWLTKYLLNYGEWNERDYYLVSTIQWPEPR